MTIPVTDQMIYAFAGEPEITGTDAHAIEVGLQAVMKILEKDYVSRWASITEYVPAALPIPGELFNYIRNQVIERAKYTGATIPDIDACEIERHPSDTFLAQDLMKLTWRIRRD